MNRILLALVCVLFFSSVALARHYFANITGVDAAKGTVTYTFKVKNEKDTEVTAKIVKDCVIKEGYYVLGKPATAKEGEELPNGLRNLVFQNASNMSPLKVDIFTAEKDDKDKGIMKGDITKILVKTK